MMNRLLQPGLATKALLIVGLSIIILETAAESQGRPGTTSSATLQITLRIHPKTIEKTEPASTRQLLEQSTSGHATISGYCSSREISDPTKVSTPAPLQKSSSRITSENQLFEYDVTVQEYNLGSIGGWSVTDVMCEAPRALVKSPSPALVLVAPI